MQSPGWTPERKMRAHLLRFCGLSFSQIAKALGGFEHCRAHARACVAGMFWREANYTRKRAPIWPPERVARLQELRASGLSNANIAAELGTTLSAVKAKLAWLKRGGGKTFATSYHTLSEADLLAAAMIADGDPMPLVMAETGLDEASVLRAVERSKARERNELHARGDILASAWGALGSERDAAV